MTKKLLYSSFKRVLGKVTTYDRHITRHKTWKRNGRKREKVTTSENEELGEIMSRLGTAFGLMMLLFRDDLINANC